MSLSLVLLLFATAASAGGMFEFLPSAEAVTYRVLLVAEQNYADGVNEVRRGAIHASEALRSAIGTTEPAAGISVKTTEACDLTAGGFSDLCRETFADLTERDVAVLYLSCHGLRRRGSVILQFVDGSEMSAEELELLLRSVPGKMILLADFCFSGALVGEELRHSFASPEGPFAGSRYHVLASASARQSSYRIGYGQAEDEIATVFSMALCDAVGWSMRDRRRGPINADTDFDGAVTLWEAYLYTARRVRYYLAIADGGTGSCRQDVVIWPAGDGSVLFRR